MNITDLQINDFFYFKNGSKLYQLVDIKYNIDYFNNNLYHYQMVGTFNFYKWYTNQKELKLRKV